VVALSLQDREGGTEVLLIHGGFATEGRRACMKQATDSLNGWSSSPRQSIMPFFVPRQGPVPGPGLRPLVSGGGPENGC
jgi:hypothetical protein